MEPDFWRARWAKQEIGFHQAMPTPGLSRHAQELGPAPKRVLVPLAGKTKDLRYLASLGHHPIGVELVEDAVKAFFAEERLSPMVTEGPGYVRYDAGGITFYAADMFKLSQEIVGAVDAIFDRAALVALPPELRRKYVQHLPSFLGPGGRILTVLFEHDGGNGPPFSVTVEDLRGYYPQARGFTVLESADILEESPRFKERGVTRLLEHTVLVLP